MNVVGDYTRVIICSAGWVRPFSSPAAALAATKVFALLWAFLLHG
jgi:hypothetical protein